MSEDFSAGAIIALIVLAVVLAFICIGPFITAWAWNGLMPAFGVTVKLGWLQALQLWMLCGLVRSVPGFSRKSDPAHLPTADDMLYGGHTPKCDSALRHAQEQTYFLDQDQSSHWYLVPTARKAEWDAWTELDEDDERAWDEPDYAQRLDGGPQDVHFKSPQFR